MLIRFVAHGAYHGWYKQCVTIESAIAGLKVERQRLQSVISALEGRIEFMRIQFVCGSFSEDDQRSLDWKTSEYIKNLEFMVSLHRNALESRHWKILEGAIPPDKEFKRDYQRSEHCFPRHYNQDGELIYDGMAWPWRMEEIERLEREYGQM